MKFVLGSKNKAKIEAVENWLKNNFKNFNSVEGVEVESEISEQPLSNEVTIDGAINRAKNALELRPDADYGVGLEGGVYKVKEKMFMNGWACLIGKDNIIKIGSTPSIEVPEEIALKLENGQELGDVMKEMHERDIRNYEGAFGILTKNMITRSKSFEMALICAWGDMDYV